jgi:hypothetical protein
MTRLTEAEERRQTTRLTEAEMKGQMTRLTEAEERRQTTRLIEAEMKGQMTRLTEAEKKREIRVEQTGSLTRTKSRKGRRLNEPDHRPRPRSERGGQSRRTLN